MDFTSFKKTIKPWINTLKIPINIIIYSEFKFFGKGSRIKNPRKVRGGKCIEIGKNAYILENSKLFAMQKYLGEYYDPEIKIGDNVYAGTDLYIVSINGVVIHDNCVISNHVYINDSSHGLDPLAGSIMEQKLFSKGKVEIGEFTFIGYRACIMPGVTLGKHCIVGANSVVTKSFPDYSMVAGCPAKLIRVYSPKSQSWVAVTE